MKKKLFTKGIGDFFRIVFPAMGVKRRGETSFDAGVSEYIARKQFLPVSLSR